MNWRQLDGNLWCADEPFSTKGLELGARMTVVRLENGELVLISPLHFSEEAQQKLTELGEVKHLIAPNKFHFLDLPEYARAYPNAQVYEAPGVKWKEELKYEVLGKETPAAWRGELSQVLFEGNALENEVVFFHPSSRTLILTDLCFNIHRRDFASRLFGFGTFGPSHLWRLMARRKNLARHSLRRILQWDFDRIIVAHGEIVESGGRAVFEDGFRWLLK
jgi:hypothetical protein